MANKKDNGRKPLEVDKDFRRQDFEIDAWYSSEGSGPIYGIIVTHETFHDSQGDAFDVCILKLTKPATGFGKDKVKIDLKEGDFLAVRINHNLRELQKWAGGAQVAFQSLDQKPIGGGRSVWRYEIHVKKGSPKREAPPVRRPSSVEDETVPF